eukprot:scaffold516_cov175-Amphora_coffeaeformis.AAC.13
MAHGFRLYLFLDLVCVSKIIDQSQPQPQPSFTEFVRVDGERHLTRFHPKKLTDPTTTPATAFLQVLRNSSFRPCARGYVTRAQ